MKEVFNGFLKRVTVRRTIETSVLINVKDEKEAQRKLDKIVKAVDKNPFGFDIVDGKTNLTSVVITSRDIVDGYQKNVYEWTGKVGLDYGIY